MGILWKMVDGKVDIIAGKKKKKTIQILVTILDECNPGSYRINEWIFSAEKIIARTDICIKG